MSTPTREEVRRQVMLAVACAASLAGLVGTAFQNWQASSVAWNVAAVVLWFTHTQRLGVEGEP